MESNIYDEFKKNNFSLFENLVYILKKGWVFRKRLILLCILSSIFASGEIITNMLAAPILLKSIETANNIQSILVTLIAFIIILVICKIGNETITVFGVWTDRVLFSNKLDLEVNSKIANTSYPNLFSPDFQGSKSKALESISGYNKNVSDVWNSLEEILKNIIGFTFYLFLLKNMNILLILLVIFTSALSFYINKKVLVEDVKLKKEENKILQRMEYISSISVSREYAKDIKVFGLQNWLEEIFEKSIKLYEGFNKKRELKHLVGNIFDLIFTFLRNAIAYYYLINLTLKNNLQASYFLLYFATLSGFTIWITGILDQINVLNEILINISSLRDFLNYKEVFKFEDGEKLEYDLNKKYEIKLENVSFKYPGDELNIINNVNLTIKPGEKVAMVGLNGAGKTTLVKLICGFLDPTEGKVLLNGEDIKEYNRNDYYKIITGIFQDFALIDGTVSLNVSQKIKDYDEDKIKEVISKAGLEDKINSFPKKYDTFLGRNIYDDGTILSGGQNQRLMIARALYKDGAIIVLDEPTSALDPIAENDIYLKYSSMTDGKTSIFISHRLASTRFCDRILYVDKGEIKEEGTHEELLQKNGLYKDLFNVQSKYYNEEEGINEG